MKKVFLEREFMQPDRKDSVALTAAGEGAVECSKLPVSCGSLVQMVAKLAEDIQLCKRTINISDTVYVQLIAA
jgi:hypothetical protein